MENVFRLIDANLNRACETLRIIEDFTRFLLNNAELSKKIKSIRHKLRNSEKLFANEKTITQFRDTEEDIGRGEKYGLNRDIKNVRDVVIGNFKRLQEAMRSLEEFSKPINVRFSKRMEKIRYEVYSLEKDISLILFPRERLYDKKLYVLLSEEYCNKGWKTVAKELVDASVDVIQIREKVISDKEFIKRIKFVSKLIGRKRIILIVNDRVHLATEAEVDGVHLGQNDMPVKKARKILGPEKVIGVSSHSLKEVERAVKDGADYIAVGKIFKSSTKPKLKCRGVDLLKRVKSKFDIPIYAIGGINIENIEKIKKAGVSNVAICSGIISQPDVGKAARKIKRKIK